MTPGASAFSKTILSLYLDLPDTPNRVSAFDRRVAQQLHSRRVPLSAIEAALLLASARRRFRSPAPTPLTPIRSLAYFLPVIDEVLRRPLPPAYVDYLRAKALTPAP